MKAFIRYRLQAILCLLLFFNGLVPEGIDTSRISYVTNHSDFIVYYKPESIAGNPGLDPDGAYPILPGETLYTPVDAVVASGNREGEIFRVPTGATVVIDKQGIPKAGNPVAFLMEYLMPGHYGCIPPPDPNFEVLSNVRQKNAGLNDGMKENDMSKVNRPYHY